MTKIAGLDLVEHGSHWVEVNGYGHGGEKEEVFLYFNATWRGQAAISTMQASRYVHSEGWSDWRIYASEAREGRYVKHPETGAVGTWPEHGGDRGRELTDLARTRLSAQARPLVEYWLAGDTYRASEHAAYLAAVERVFRNAYDPARDARERAALFLERGKIDIADQVRVERAARAYEEYRARLTEVTA